MVVLHLGELRLEINASFASQHGCREAENETRVTFCTCVRPGMAVRNLMEPPPYQNERVWLRLNRRLTLVPADKFRVTLRLRLMLMLRLRLRLHLFGFV